MSTQELIASDPVRVGPYRLLHRLGSGGMGVVYLGEAQDGAQVAVKCLPHGVSGEVRGRLRREATYLSQVRHPRVAAYVADDTQADQPWIAMQYVAGPSLAQASVPLGPAQLRHLAEGVADALAALHRQGLTHRDVKPGNIILTRDGPVLVDLGIAAGGGLTALTAVGMVVGTPEWMAPEQLTGHGSSHAVDIWGWACVVAYAATGRPPFGSGAIEALAYRIRHEAADLRGVPDWLHGALRGALGKDPRTRPTASQLAAVDGIRAVGAVVRSRPAAPPPRVPVAAGRAPAGAPHPPRTPARTPARTPPAPPVPGPMPPVRRPAASSPPRPRPGRCHRSPRRPGSVARSEPGCCGGWSSRCSCSPPSSWWPRSSTPGSAASWTASRGSGRSRICVIVSAGCSAVDPGSVGDMSEVGRIPDNADVIVVGAGLAGLVATYELTKAGRRVLVIDQENRKNLGGQAFWSLGGLFLVDTPEQRRLGIKDSHELALQDWLGSAGFDREAGDNPEDKWPRQWAEAYVRFAATEKRDYLHDLGLRITPVVGWAERGGADATGHGNSVPRFHLAWGTGPDVVRIFAEPVLAAERRGLVTFAFRHQVDELIMDSGVAVGVRGTKLADEAADLALERGVASGRRQAGQFEFRAKAVVVASGGIGHNHKLIRKNWPTKRLGRAPKTMISGVPAHVDGRMLAITEAAGARIVNRDRMWHYTEGINNWDPIWPDHAIRIIPGPSSLWFDALGNRLPAPNFPGFDTNGTLKAILKTGHDYSWFVLTQSIIEKEFALSGSEQNPDITGKDVKLALKTRLSKGAAGPVEAFKEHGEDFVVADNLRDLVDGMNKIGRGAQVDHDHLEAQIVARDREVGNKYSKDLQLMAVRNARNYIGDKIARVAKPHRILDPAHGPLIAVRLNILTRKTLGGVETNLDSQVMDADGAPIPGLYAAGEVAGFGGGGVHGYNALEGTFLGGCIFSGRAAGLALAKSIG